MSEAICTWPSCGHTAKGQCGLRLVFDPVTRSAVRINPQPDLPPTLSAAMELPEVRALVETAQWARNRLEIIADESWHGDGRDLKRSIIGIFADFDKALADCGSQVPLSLASIKEPKT